MIISSNITSQELLTDDGMWHKGNKDNDTIAIAISFGMVFFSETKAQKVMQQWPASQAENSSVATSK